MFGAAALGRSPMACLVRRSVRKLIALPHLSAPSACVFGVASGSCRAFTSECDKDGRKWPLAVKSSFFVEGHNQNNEQKDRKGAPQGLVATRALAPGDFVFEWTMPVSAERSHWSLQVGPDEHLPLHDHVLRFINHSCEPSIAMQDGLRFYARQAIRAGEEMTIDYNAFEDELQHGTFSCACGMPACVGEVRGWRHLTPMQKSARSALVVPWLWELWPAEM